jgi:SsrA-binding protein
MQAKPSIKSIAVNRKVRRLFDILERYEAGLVLKGSEIKSLRAGRVSFKDSHVVFRQGEAFLVDLHIARYEQASYLGHEPDRDRKLLLHKREINLLRGRSEQKGLTVIPLEIYLKDAKAKVAIGLARGRKLHDQREELKRRAQERDTAREMARMK